MGFFSMSDVNVEIAEIKGLLGGVARDIEHCNHKLENMDADLKEIPRLVERMNNTHDTAIRAHKRLDAVEAALHAVEKQSGLNAELRKEYKSKLAAWYSLVLTVLGGLALYWIEKSL